MKVAIGCDHGALELKAAIIDHLEKKGIEASMSNEMKCLVRVT